MSGLKEFGMDVSIGSIPELWILLLKIIEDLIVDISSIGFFDLRLELQRFRISCDLVVDVSIDFIEFLEELWILHKQVKQYE